MLPEWTALLLTALGSGGVGALISALLTRRTAADADRQALIDQLQEELKADLAELAAERDEIKAEREQYQRNLDRLWTDKAASREHVAALRDHIWQRKDPPPPDPPDGYIH